MKTAFQIDWGTVPQWLTFLGVVIGFIFTARQLRHNQSVRETENILSLSDSTIVHNANFLEKPSALKAIQMLEGLNIPASEPDAEAYWAIRGVHLSHITSSGAFGS